MRYRDALLSQTASESEVKLARGKLITNEAKYHHEMLLVKKTARRGESDMRDQIRLLEDRMAREHEETSVYEDLSERLSYEKRHIQNLEISVA